ncbi:hypothetical protein CDL15_Pgr027364 [Punica granatum]|uniref:TORTIFOLIA1/SINE1-2 N-terminal domain-containing protein n=1 Tax=Punica granatum TaxID=22663 RepID=A0A218Y0M2_PUNGR|nr:hypothetical protein CDL15_Pgr027364 [Punica granatum]
MSSRGPKPSKPLEPHPHSSYLQPNSRAPNSSSSSSSILSRLAMVERKQKILTSLSKLADRDTYQISVSDLEFTIQTISHDAIPMLLNCLFESSNDPKPTVKKEPIRLLAFMCSNNKDSTFNHLTKIIAQLSSLLWTMHMVTYLIKGLTQAAEPNLKENGEARDFNPVGVGHKRLKDLDYGVRDACQDAIHALSAQYLKNEGVVGLFVKLLFEAMEDQNKAVQSGVVMCMTKMVECARMVGFSRMALKCVR